MGEALEGKGRDVCAVGAATGDGGEVGKGRVASLGAQKGKGSAALGCANASVIAMDERADDGGCARMLLLAESSTASCFMSDWTKSSSALTRSVRFVLSWRNWMTSISRCPTCCFLRSRLFCADTRLRAARAARRATRSGSMAPFCCLRVGADGELPDCE